MRTVAGLPGVAFRGVEIEGPLLGARVDRWEGDPEALSRGFMARAYRRPVRDTEFARYRKILLDHLPKGREEALIAAYTAVLCSPGFRYFDEQPGDLTGRALTSRLSYFLGNGPPDERLLTFRASGQLAEPAVLKAETDRLLNDPRSTRLDYRLDLRKVVDTTPDVMLCPEYYVDDLLTESALGEPRIFFRHLLRNDLQREAESTRISRSSTRTWPVITACPGP